MNTMKMPSIVQMEEEQLSELVNQVKESVATNVPLSRPSQQKKKFGIVDLWNFRRKSRTNGIIIR